ncbi:MAG TPA: M55 family metallopeptidase [Gemmatimonadaceae bacterium]
MRLATLVVALATLAATAGAQRPLKVYISADMEGITGVSSDQQLGPTGFEYAQARQWMTAEVLAAIQGAREAGATEFVISDSHGNGQSLLIDRFPTDIPIVVVRAFPRPLGMMEGIDSTFAAAIFIGYHTSTSSLTGVRAHTMSSALLTRIAINGTSMSEAGINAAIAAQFGVPVVMITGDDQIVAETKQRLGPIEGVAVKQAIGFHSAATLLPEVAQGNIRQRAKIAVGRRAEMRPYTMSKPLSLEVSFKNYRPVELLGYLSNVQRIDSHTVRYAAKDMVDVSKFLEFVTNYDPSTTP